MKSNRKNLLKSSLIAGIFLSITGIEASETNLLEYNDLENCPEVTQELIENETSYYADHTFEMRCSEVNSVEPQKAEKKKTKATKAKVEEKVKEGKCNEGKCGEKGQKAKTDTEKKTEKTEGKSNKGKCCESKCGGK